MSMFEEQVALIDLQYLPSIEYFTALFCYKEIIFEVEEHFEKQTYRNRCNILTANKVDKLSVPVIGGRKKIKMKDIMIDHTQGWQKDHRQAIQSAYGRAPFFEFYEEYFWPFFQKKEKYLVDYNIGLLTLCLKLLEVNVKFSFSEKYEKTPLSNEFSDLRSVIHPKKGYKENHFFKPVVYPQVFGKNFVANLSIIDLIFCEGPNAKSIVTKSMEPE